MSSPTQSPAPIKGSWEALIEQAFQLDENRNEEALPIYQKLITRLQKMPEAKLKDRDERLQRILETSCYRSANLKNSLERFDDALKDFDILQSVVPEESKRHVVHAKVRTLQMMGRYDDAIALVRDLPVQNDEPLSNPVQEFGTYLDALRFDEAQSILNTIKEQLDSESYRTLRSADNLTLDIAQFHSMSAILALELQEWEKGIDEYQKAKEKSKDLMDEGDYLLYSNLVHRGQSEFALPIIEKEPLLPRRLFWQGLAYFYMGQTEEATALWEKVADSKVSQEEAQAYVDLVLTHFYLGDKERIGLQLILSMLDELERPSWQLLYFAAIGWAIRDNKTNMRVNLEHAIDQCRREGIGRYLPWTLWPPVRDLLSDEMQSAARSYFDPKDLKHYFQI